MYDELNYDITVLDLPNIIYAHPKEKGSNPTVVSHPFLRPLLTKLAKARPKWKLVGVGFDVRVEGPSWVRSFRIFDGNMELGTLMKSYNYSTSSDCYAIDNMRMAAARQRGSTTTTKDANKAFKVITKNFYGKTPEEMIKDAKERASGHVQMNVRSRTNRYTGIIGNIRDGLLAYAEANWDGFLEFAKQAGNVGMTNLDQYDEAKEDYQHGAALALAYNGGETTIVVLRGSEYIINGPDGYKILTHEDLTLWEKRAIGMLKLSDTGVFLPPFGVKSGEGEMCILPEVKEAK